MTANLVSPSVKRAKSDLVHLRTLPSVEPATSTGRVAWIWPEIEAALRAGKKLREVWEAVRRWLRHSISSVSGLRFPPSAQVAQSSASSRTGAECGRKLNRHIGFRIPGGK